MSSETAGTVLARARTARRLSIDQAAQATRIRAPYLRALEADDFAALPAPVYVRGYLRTYAGHLEIDSAELIARLPASLRPTPRPILSRPPVQTRVRRVALTWPIALLCLVAAGLAGLGLFVQHELKAQAQLRDQAAPTPVHRLRAAPPPPAVRPLVAPLAVPRPIWRTIHVEVTATEQVWIDATVDGVARFGSHGRFLDPGTSVWLVGREVSITSGKGTATVVRVAGEAPAALGGGVTTAVFTAQT